MDEDLENEEQNAEMPIEGMDLSGLAAANPALAPFMSRYFGAMEAESAALRQQAANRQEQFKAAEEAIRQQRFGAPTTSQQLFALSQALLSPRPYRGIAGTLANVVPALGKMSTLQSDAESQRNAALEKLRREYLMGQSESAVAAARAQREGLGKILPSVVSATKPRTPRTALGEGNRVYDLDTGEEIVPLSYRLAQIPPQAIEALRAQMADPSVPSAVKIQSRRSFETTYGVPVADALGGQ